MMSLVLTTVTAVSVSMPAFATAPREVNPPEVSIMEPSQSYSELYDELCKIAEARGITLMDKGDVFAPEETPSESGLNGSGPNKAAVAVPPLCRHG